MYTVVLTFDSDITKECTIKITLFGALGTNLSVVLFIMLYKVVLSMCFSIFCKDKCGSFHSFEKGTKAIDSAISLITKSCVVEYGY